MARQGGDQSPRVGGAKLGAQAREGARVRALPRPRRVHAQVQSRGAAETERTHRRRDVGGEALDEKIAKAERLLKLGRLAKTRDGGGARRAVRSRRRVRRGPRRGSDGGRARGGGGDARGSSGGGGDAAVGRSGGGGDALSDAEAEKNENEPARHRLGTRGLSRRRRERTNTARGRSLRGARTRPARPSPNTSTSSDFSIVAIARFYPKPDRSRTAKVGPRERGSSRHPQAVLGRRQRQRGRHR